MTAAHDDNDRASAGMVTRECAMSGSELYAVYLDESLVRGIADIDEWYELTSREKDVWNSLAYVAWRMAQT